MLGAILVASRFLGVAPSTRLPILNIALQDYQYFPHSVAVLLIIATAYLTLEWKLSSRRARNLYSSIVRRSVTLLMACGSLWLGYPLIAADTRFETVSPAWFFGFWAIGFSLGMVISILIFASLMIRSPEEAKTVHLSLIPKKTVQEYIIWIPAAMMLLVGYYVLWYLSPHITKGIGTFLVCVPFLFVIGEEFAWLYLSEDERGNRIPFAKRIAPLKSILYFHDYASLLDTHGGEMAKEVGFSSTTPPHMIQEKIRDRYSSKSGDRFYFHVQHQEAFQAEFYLKDGNETNLSPENKGVRFHKSHGKKNQLRVLIIPDDPNEKQQEMEISISLMERYADEYLSTHTEESDLTFRKIISYAINQTVKKKMFEQEGPLLHRSVQAGQIDTVKELLGHEGIDVNKRAEYGWTALLYASANGYPEIAQ